jgi:hypothetical protein
MFIAKQLKEKNIAEYLLYMWQVEDLLRANHLDIEEVKRTLVASYQVDEVQKAELTQWYENLIEMMRTEGVAQEGHLQINKNVLINLTDLHLRLLRSPKVPFYGALYYQTLPFIVELRAKSRSRDLPELETCFDALYGVMLLRLQKKEVGTATAKAVDTIGQLVAQLAKYYEMDRRGELDKLLND